MISLRGCDFKMEEKNDIFNDDNKNVFATIGKDLTNVYMHMLKHLNRYHAWKCYIPRWLDNKWQNDIRIDVTEANGIIDNRKAEKNLQLKENELGDKQYLIIFRLFNLELKQYIGYGFAEDRKDFFKSYIKNIQNAIEIRKNLIGVDTVIN
jgi:hypothetical protein